MEAPSRETLLELQSIYRIDSEIAKVFGKSVKVIRDWRHKRGIKSLYRPGVPQYTKQDIE